MARIPLHPRPRRPLRAGGLRSGPGRAGVLARRRSQLGATVELSGKQAGEELTVRLQPCGRAKARFVGPDGKPAAIKQIYIYFQILMTPGGPAVGQIARGESIAADGAFLPNVDPKHHPNGMAPDADGRVTFDALIPAPCTGSATGPPSTSRTRATRSARTSPSSRARRSTSAISSSRSHRADASPMSPRFRDFRWISRHHPGHHGSRAGTIDTRG